MARKLNELKKALNEAVKFEEKQPKKTYRYQVLKQVKKINLARLKN